MQEKPLVDEFRNEFEDESGNTEPVESSDDEIVPSQASSLKASTSTPVETSPKGNGKEDLPLKTRMYLIKKVFGKIPSRDELVQVLKKNFNASSKNLVSLTASDVMLVMTKKLLRHGYCEIDDTNPQSKKFTILKNIAL